MIGSTKISNAILHLGDCRELIKSIPDNSIDLILTDIPYGISIEDWDVLHDNKNSALLGSSPAQVKAGKIFKKRGKPLNGWSEADKKIPLEYYNWVLGWATDFLRVLKPGGSAVIFSGRRFAHRCICALEDSGFTYKDMWSWNKGKAAYRAQHVSKVFDRRGDVTSSEKWSGWKLGNLKPVFEPILWFCKPYKIGGTLADNILTYSLGGFNESAFKKYGLDPANAIEMKSDSSDYGLHPTQKPVKLMKFIIELLTIENQVVLDPFMGSCTTGVASLELNRGFVGFENDPISYGISCERVNYS